MRTAPRTRNLCIAAAFAVAAATLAGLAASRGGGGARAATAPATTPVLVATRDLPVGTPAAAAFSGGGIAVRRLPADAVAADAATSPAFLRGAVVLQPIYRGEQVAVPRLGPAAAEGVRAQLSGELRVLQLPGSAAQLLAGTLRAGDRVDVVGSVHRGAEQTPTAGVVVSDVLVVAAPVSASAGAGGQLSATLQLTEAQAQALFYVVENGDWSFVLRGPHARRGPVAPVTGADLFEGR